MELGLSPAEQHGFAVVKEWVKLGCSARRRHQLFELLDDDHGWRPPRIIGGATAHAGSDAFWKVCVLRGLAIRRGQFADLKTLLKHIEKPAPEVDIMSLKRGCQLVILLLQLLANRRKVAIVRTRLQKGRFGKPRPPE